MRKVYTDRWNGFQFRAPVYLDGHHNPYKFDLVKWETAAPFEATDPYTGEKVIKTEYCFSIGALIWNPKEEEFNFESCGLRYLAHRIDGLEIFIMDFVEMMKKELCDDEECE